MGGGGTEKLTERAEAGSGERRGGSARRRGGGGERVITLLLGASALLSLLTTAGIVASLAVEAAGFFAAVPLRDFLTDTAWTPLFAEKHFGILPLLGGTLLVVLGASLVALPLGLGSAVYLAEVASPSLRKLLKPVLEVLAGIPSVVYGYLALTGITPVLRALWPETEVFNAASASLAMGIMILPMVASLSEDALAALPRSLREGAYAVGATRYEAVSRVLVPAAASGIVASFILAVSRAVGETMIVAIAAGSTPRLTLNPLEGVQTMTGYIVQVTMGDVPAGSLEYRTVFAVGLSLFLITFVTNLIGYRVAGRRG